MMVSSTPPQFGDPASHPAEQSIPPTSFRSILFPNASDTSEIDKRQQPDFFIDLNLDQVVGSATEHRDEYALKPFFYSSAADTETVRYRQDVFRDIERGEVSTGIRSFASAMQKVRGWQAQSQKCFYKRERQRWFLDAVNTYCLAVRQLTQNLAKSEIRSSGLIGLQEYLESYGGSPQFHELGTATRRLLESLNGIVYSLHIAGKRITASKYQDQPDYGADVIQTFEKFRQAVPREYRFRFRSGPEMDHVEAAIVDMVAQLYPEIFSSLDDFCDRYAGFLDTTIARFDREVQFYIAWIEHIQPLMRTGLRFCYPVVSGDSKEISGREIFDVALAGRIIQNRGTIVTNEFSISNPERIIVVSGPNQGGKTTFARTFGQLHYLASLGCPVAAKEAHLFFFDRLFTHFEREEDVRTLSGKLEDELIRIHRIFENATSKSILVMNESFLSTTLNDALYLSREVMKRIIDLDMLCVSVTFLDELSCMSPTTVSMVSSVDPDDLARRTFKVVRKPADGLAYAMAIAAKYGLTYAAVKKHTAEHTKTEAE